jgi:large subunit ribosomal protein L16
MGKGKGNVKYWVCFIKKGQVLFEISGVDQVLAKKVLESSSKKLPVLTKFFSY